MYRLQIVRISKRKLSSTVPRAPIGFVFDIDGVLMQSRNPIVPFASNTLQMLRTNKIPFALLTNGGGQLEETRINFLNSCLSPVNSISNLIDIGLDSDHNILTTDQLVQSHTPLKQLTNKFKRVLVIGGPDPNAREVILSYGFEEVIRPIDIIRAAPEIWPFTRYTTHEISNHSLSPDISEIDLRSIDAIFVINDPRDMGSDLQITIDALCCDNGVITTRRKDLNSSIPSIPIIFSNMDLQWSTGYSIPRFGVGAFRIAIKELYKTLNQGKELEEQTIGKPWPINFAYAEHVLNNEWLKISNNQFSNDLKISTNFGSKPTEQLIEKVYMVGDNPESDIRGGNDYGWETILVKTGVYKDGDFEINKSLSKPTLGIYDNVWDGVYEALKKNNIDINL
ncbi:hypothetical protein CANINC_004416 [Pichia inconspicua]|uniref:TIGR01456 family HAD hydrolase n=1 Tax=Pichia inconspicua TaxID=52247 RepID=A0A4T0WXQ8_9ASCO|nr:hypothetical protein CANINC_004416 [[Candida] inconspicua]